MKVLSEGPAHRRRGTVTLFFSFAIIPMIGLMAMSLEFGNVAVHQRRLQNYVDSKAVAALRENFGRLSERVEHHGFTNGITPCSGCQRVVAREERGIWDFRVPRDRFTTSIPASLSEGKVPAYRFDVDPFRVPLLFGTLFNVPFVEIRAEAVAISARREIVIVQDISSSMCAPDPIPCDRDGGPLLGGRPGTHELAGPESRIEQAKAAALTLVATMASQRLPGDRIAFVPFSGIDPVPPETILPMETLNGGASTVTEFIENLRAGGGTNIPEGLKAGILQFNAIGPSPEIERVIILIGDGLGGMDARDQADRAEELGIDIYTILYCATGQASFDEDCSSAEGTYANLVRGDGRAFLPEDLPQLTQAMVDVVTGISMKLVR